MLFTDCELRKMKRIKNKGNKILSFKSDHSANQRDTASSALVQFLGRIKWGHLHPRMLTATLDENWQLNLLGENTIYWKTDEIHFLDCPARIRARTSTLIAGWWFKPRHLLPAWPCVPKQDTEFHYNSMWEEKVKVTLDKSFCQIKVCLIYILTYFWALVPKSACLSILLTVNI